MIEDDPSSFLASTCVLRFFSKMFWPSFVLPDCNTNVSSFRLFGKFKSIIFVNQFSLKAMLSKWITFGKFCTQIIKEHKNSINPVSQHVAYGYYFPKEWSEEFIYSQIDPAKKNIQHMQIILNRLGQHSGKVLFRFVSLEAMKRLMDKYNEDFIITKESTHRVVIKPFQLKTKEISQQNTKKKTKHPVRVKNLDFDITNEELERLGKDFGKIEFIEMQVRANGLNNGIATLYFKKPKEAQDFAYFCDGLLYKQRKLKAEVIQQSKKSEDNWQFLQQPKITLDSNQQVYKRLVAEEYKSDRKNSTDKNDNS